MYCTLDMKILNAKILKITSKIASKKIDENQFLQINFCKTSMFVHFPQFFVKIKLFVNSPVYCNQYNLNCNEETTLQTLTLRD